MSTHKRTTVVAYDSNGNASFRKDEAERLLALYPLKPYPSSSVAAGDNFRVYPDHSVGRLVYVLTCQLDDGTQAGSRLYAECGSRGTAMALRRSWRNRALWREAAIAEEARSNG